MCYAGQRHLSRTAGPLVLAVALILAMAAPAAAERSDEPASSDSVPEQFAVELGAAEVEASVNHLLQSDMPRRVEATGAGGEIIFEYQGDLDIAFVAEFETTATPGEFEIAAQPHGVSPQGVGAGVGWRGLYVSFGPNSQRLVGQGAVAAVGATICSLVPPLCPVSVGIAAAAGAWIERNGVCPGGRDLRYYYQPATQWGCAGLF